MAVVGIMAVQQLYAHHMTACLYLTPSPKTKCLTAGAATFEFCLETKFRSSLHFTCDKHGVKTLTPANSNILLPAASNPTASPKSTECPITKHYRRERGIPTMPALSFVSSALGSFGQ